MTSEGPPPPAACAQHPAAREGLGRCTRCERLFCADCLAVLRGRPHCAACKLETVRDVLSGLRPGGLPLASVWRRAVALWLDSVVQGCGGYLGALALMLAVRSAALDGRFAAFFILGGMLLLSLLYEGLLLQLRGQTAGKMAVRLKVVSADGGELTARQAWTRAAVKLVLGSSCGVSYLPALFTAERLTIHDLVARTRVLRLD